MSSCNWANSPKSSSISTPRQTSSKRSIYTSKTSNWEFANSNYRALWICPKSRWGPPLVIDAKFTRMPFLQNLDTSSQKQQQRGAPKLESRGWMGPKSCTTQKWNTTPTLKPKVYGPNWRVIKSSLEFLALLIFDVPQVLICSPLWANFLQWNGKIASGKFTNWRREMKLCLQKRKDKVISENRFESAEQLIKNFLKLGQNGSKKLDLGSSASAVLAASFVRFRVKNSIISGTMGQVWN